MKNIFFRFRKCCNLTAMLSGTFLYVRRLVFFEQTSTSVELFTFSYQIIFSSSTMPNLIDHGGLCVTIRYL